MSETPKTLIEELFEKGIMVMGPSRHNPEETVGTFPPDLLPKLVAERTAQLQTFAFMDGRWLTENSVPATPFNPAYIEHGEGVMKLASDGRWIVRLQGQKEVPYITFDPFSKQWMYVLAEGAYGILRSPGWVQNRIAFIGLMTMIGAERDLRHTITKVSSDEFHAVNEELHDAKWIYVDEWRYRRA